MGPDHGHVPDVSVEHLQHHLVAKRSGADGERGKLITSVTGRIDAHASGHHPIAQVTVGHDPQLPSGRRTRAALAPASAMRRAASRTVSLGLADDRPFVHEPRDRLLRRVEVVLSAPPVAATGERAGCAPRTALPPAGQAGHDRVRGQPIAERVLASPGLESRG